MNKKFSIFAIVFLTFWTFKVKAQTFQVDDVKLNPNNLMVEDPEIYIPLRKMVFYDNVGGLWVSDLDSVTGLCNPPDCRGCKADSGVTFLRQPEWGFSQQGLSFVYARGSSQQTAYLWKAVPDAPNHWNISQLTSDPARTPYVSTNSSDTALQIAFVKKVGNYDQLFTAYEGNINNPYLLNNVGPLQGIRFISNMPRLLFSHKNGSDYEIAEFNLATGIQRVITNLNEGKIFEAFAFQSPEYNNQTIMLCYNKNTFFILQYDSVSNCTLLDTLIFPASSPHQYIYSPEPIVFDGKTYIVTAAGDSSTIEGDIYGATQSSIWILSIDGLLKRRIDIGSINSQVLYRYEPEPFVANNEIMVIYQSNPNPLGYGDTRRAKTGVIASVTDIGAPSNTGISISLFPNPAGTSLFLSSLPVDFHGTIYIYNPMGQMLLTEHKTGSQFSIETEHLNSGIYFIQIKAENGKVFTGKFTKQ